MPPEEIEVRCPQCGWRYSTVYRPSMNLKLDQFSEEYVERMSTGVCPDCGHKVRLATLIVQSDGIWHLPVA